MTERIGSVPVIIGVAGGTGSGKTTFINAIRKNMERRDVATVQHDSYYKDRSHLPASQRARVNYDHPEALDTCLLVHQLKELIAGREIEVPAYDFKNHVRMANVSRLSPPEVVVVEGILIFAEPELRAMMDAKIFIDTVSFPVK